jgi:hypothetical protein
MATSAGSARTPNHWPFLGIVVILIVLILLTPTLTPGGPPAGSVPTQGSVVVDHRSGSNTTHLYVRGLGTVRYQSIDVGLSSNVSWPAPPNAKNLTFTNWTNQTYVVVLGVSYVSNPTALNVSVVYVDQSGTTATFIGLFVLFVQLDVLYVTPMLPGLAGIPPTPLVDLPVSLLLETAPSPGGP